jgi:hypothetical protein
MKMPDDTVSFIKGKLFSISLLIQSIRGKYHAHPDFDKNLGEAFYAINRAAFALSSDIDGAQKDSNKENMIMMINQDLERMTFEEIGKLYKHIRRDIISNVNKG